MARELDACAVPFVPKLSDSSVQSLGMPQEPIFSQQSTFAPVPNDYYGIPYPSMHYAQPDFYAEQVSVVVGRQLPPTRSAAEALGAVDHVASLPTADALPLDWDGASGSCFSQLPKLDKPFVVLVDGARGAGATTQCKLLAEKYRLMHVIFDMGEYESRRLFPELRSQLQLLMDSFRLGEPSSYGLILDGFAVNRVVMTYTLDLLNEVGLSCNTTVFLDVDEDSCLSRLATRGETRVSGIFESNCLKDEALSLLRLHGGLERVSAIDHEGEVFHDICRRVNRSILGVFQDASGSRRAESIRAFELEHGITMVQRFSEYSDLLDKISDTLGTAAQLRRKFPGRPPGQLMIRKDLPVLRSHISSFSAFCQPRNGTRLLVCRVGEDVVAFPVEMDCLYRIDPTLVPNHWKAWKASSGVTLICDATVVRLKNGKPKMLLFDVLFWAKDDLVSRGNEQELSDRRAIIHDMTRGSTWNPWGFIAMMPYYPLNAIPAFSDIPYEIEGIVFQLSAATYGYRFDKGLLYWKVPEHFTTTVKLVNPTRVDTGTSFSTLARCENGREVPSMIAFLFISKEMVDDLKLSDGSVVNCRRRDGEWLVTSTTTEPLATIEAVRFASTLELVSEEDLRDKLVK